MGAAAGIQSIAVHVYVHRRLQCTGHTCSTYLYELCGTCMGPGGRGLHVWDYVFDSVKRFRCCKVEQCRLSHGAIWFNWIHALSTANSDMLCKSKPVITH